MSTAVATKTKIKSKRLPPYHLVLLDDNNHTAEYVIEMFGKIFHYSNYKSKQLIKNLNKDNRVIIFTSHFELVEFKKELVENYGPDQRIKSCRESMKTVIQEAI